MDVNALKKLKVTELKELLGNHGLSQAGKKDELVARLVEAGIAAPEGVEDELSHLAPPPQDDDGFSWDTPSASNNVGTSEAQPAPVIPEPATVAAPPPTASKPAAAPIAITTSVSAPAPAPISPPTPGTSSVSTNADDETERRKQRAKRFGLPVSEDVKKAERAKRFGESVITKPAGQAGNNNGNRKRTPDMATYVPPAARANHANKRQDKPGKLSMAPMTKDEEAIKRRQERFGIVSGANTSQTAQKPAVDPEEAERRRRRAERFGISEGDNASKKLKTN